MERHAFQHDGLRLSYLDAGGGGRPIVALHAHWMEAATYVQLAERLAPRWRVIALDQRGHGYSDHASSYTRDDYLGDLEALLDHVGIAEPVVLLGNSLGGVNAYQFAGRDPARVRALIIEDIGAEVASDAGFVLNWSGTFATREQLAEKIGPRLAPYLADSFRHTAAGWQLAFEPREMLISQDHAAGDHWPDWLASDCPALLIRGADSPLTTEAELAAMASQRAQTQLAVLKAGHVVHVDAFEEFSVVVERFLEECCDTPLPASSEFYSSLPL